ncbi:Cytochrome p450 [Thalictrum thalictroides]|uniref:Cytochrome p450 n=1 Tax=Thalictrum thalictroides TaxID=46969 RepID=A0A7J6VBM0_THATH|nr:Cytochrome p450 [Thalictrum thalictroides]
MAVDINLALYWSEYHLVKRWPELCLAFFCFIFIKWYLKHKNEVLVKWPILDLLPSILKNQHRMQDWSVELANSVGSSIIARGPFFARLNLVLTFDVRNAEYITKTNFSNFPKGADYIEIFDIIGSGIFNMEYEYWHAQRKLANSTFMSKEFRSYVAKTTLDVVENSLLPLLSIQSSVIDLEDIFLRFTFDSIFTVIFGRNPNSLSLDLPCNELAQAIDVVTEAIYYRHIVPTSWWKLCRWLMIGSEKKLANAWKTIDRCLEHYVLLKRDDLHQGLQQNDMVTSFILSQEKELNNYLIPQGDAFLKDNGLSFLFAGRDSSSTALAWFFWLIERNPNVESKILEELRHVHANKNDEDDALKAKRPYVFTAEDLKGLVYLHASLCESLRLYPPLPITHRGVQKEDVLPDGTMVKPGWKILISMYAMGRSESVWGKDCLEYRPERWIDENGKLNPIPLTKFFTFFAGPRNCIGKDMAFTQMKLVIGAVLFNFHVELVEGHTVRAKSSIVLHMQDGLKVRIRKRSTQE